MLYENTCKETDQIRAMQQDIRLLKRHAVIDAAGQMLHPDPVLTAHMLFITVLLLLATEEQTLWTELAMLKQSQRYTYWL